MANKRLDFIKRASSSAPADRNEGTKRYLDTDKQRQGYTSKSLPSLRGGTTPGGRGSRGTAPQRAGKGGSGMPANGVPVMPNNGLQQQADDKPGKAPYTTEEQRAKFFEQVAGMYSNRQKKAQRDAAKKNLGKRFNGSNMGSIPGGRGIRPGSQNS